MVRTNVDTESFFNGAQQMAIPNAIFTSGLIGEGIATVEDLDKFNNEDLKSVLENMREPAGTMPDPTDEHALRQRTQGLWREMGSDPQQRGRR